VVPSSYKNEEMNFSQEPRMTPCWRVQNLMDFEICRTHSQETCDKHLKQDQAYFAQKGEARSPGGDGVHGKGREHVQGHVCMKKERQSTRTRAE
jgi:hypothetical protein